MVDKYQMNQAGVWADKRRVNRKERSLCGLKALLETVSQYGELSKQLRIVLHCLKASFP